MRYLVLDYIKKTSSQFYCILRCVYIKKWQDIEIFYFPVIFFSLSHISSHRLIKQLWLLKEKCNCYNYCLFFGRTNGDFVIKKNQKNEKYNFFYLVFLVNNYILMINIYHYYYYCYYHYCYFKNKKTQVKKSMIKRKYITLLTIKL